MLRLITLPISHYCEKARWALDLAGLDYAEERHVQVVHRFAARRAGGGATVPVLLTPDGVIGGSAEILAWADRACAAQDRLLPDDGEALAECRGLCRRFDEVLGPSSRRLIYVHMLPERSLVFRHNNVGVPDWEDRLLRGGYPLVTAMLARVLDIRPGVERQDEKSVFAEFDRVAELLADGRPYLCGERFGAADLTFAALAAPVTVPVGYGVPLPQPEVLPPATAALCERARAHPAGVFALEMYARHRPRAGSIVGSARTGAPA